MEEFEKKHIDMLREHLSECMVLLKKNGDFPLSTPSDIALYGNGVRRTIKGGTGSGEVNSRYFNNIETAFINAGFNIKTKDWLDKYDEAYLRGKKTFKKHLKEKAKKVPAQMKGCLNLSDEEKAQLKKLLDKAMQGIGEE